MKGCPDAYTDKVGPSYVIAILPQLTEFHLAGMMHVNWSTAAQIIATKNNAALEKICAVAICYASQNNSIRSTSLMLDNSLPHYDNSSTTDIMLMLPDASPTVVSRIFNYLADFIWKGFNSSVEYMQLYAQEVTNNAPSYFPNADNTEVNDWLPYNNSLTTINSGDAGYGVQPLGLPYLP